MALNPHPNPPPPAGEGVRGEAEDGWGLAASVLQAVMTIDEGD